MSELPDECGLFDLPDGYEPPPPPEPPSRTQQYHRRVARRIAQGYHPLGEPIRLHPDAPRELDSEEARRSDATGPRCGSCKYRQQIDVGQAGQRRVPKCMLPTMVGDRTTYPRETASETSDVAAWWPGCTDYELEPVRRGRKT